MLKKVILCPNPYRDHELTVAKEAKRILDSVHCPNVVCVPFRNEEKPEGYGLDIRPLQQELRGADMIIAFGGEIEGGGKSFTIPGSTASQFGGLVKYSMGSVVRNITIEYTGSISLSCNEPPSSEISPAFFGGVVGYAFGGDTILDGVSVSIANLRETKGSHSYLAAVGGYVGLVGGAFS